MIGRWFLGCIVSCVLIRAHVLVCRQAWIVERKQKKRAMPRDSNQRSRRAHSSFFANRKPPPLIPSLVVGAVFLFALLFLTVPNWGEFSRSVSQFPALWQISSNRREIIFLVIRVCSPLLLAAIAGACCWLWYTIKAYLRPETPTEQVQPRGSMPPSSPVRPRRASTSSMPESGQRVAPSL